MYKLIILIIALILSNTIIFSQWENVSNGLSPSVNLRAMVSTGNYLFAGGLFTDSLYKGKIFRSDNLGLNWTLTPYSYNAITSFTYNNGKLFAGTFNSSIMFSTDNGLSWFRVNIDEWRIYPIESSGNYMYAGWNSTSPSGGGGLIVSTDYGVTWVNKIFSWNGFSSIAIKGNIVLAGKGNIPQDTTSYYISTDYGESWSTGTMSNVYITSLAVINNYTFAGLTYDGVYVTTNDGLSWSQTSLTNKSIYSFAVNGSDLYASVYDYDVEKYRVYMSTNYGGNWINISREIENYYGRLYIAGGYLFLVRNFSIWRLNLNSIFHTITGTVMYRDNSQNVSAGYVKALRHTYMGSTVVVDSAVIQSNGTYSLIHIPPGDTVDLMAFQDDEYNSFDFVPTYYVSTIYWQDAEHLVLNNDTSGIDISVYRITNDGLSSGKISGGVYGYTDSWLGISDARLYARSMNTFRSYDITDNAGLYEIDSLPSGFYRIICNRIGYPTQTRYVYLGNINRDNINFYFNYLVGITPESEIPDNFALSQNYPNPFNPTTKIQFSLPLPSKGGVQAVKLIIYDILGREITKLVNKELKPGNYEVEWDATNYPSGVYFYQITAGEYSETKKMILIK